MPAVVSPLVLPIAPRRVTVPCAGRDYVHELKWDGFRGVVSVGAGTSVLTSKRGQRFRQFAPLVAALEHALSGRHAVLDGEIVCLDAHGRPDFRALLFRRGAPSFMAFDLLALDGEDLRTLPLLDRKRRLRRVVPRRHAVLHYVPHVRGRGRDFFAAACRLDLEGVVCKRADSPYVGDPSPWCKVLNPAYSQKVDRHELFTRRG